eukprot:gene5259-5923_t
MAKSVPGSAGWTLTGDRSIEFAKKPLEFIEKHQRQHASKIFLARALNKPTVFVASNKGVKEVLHEKEHSFDMGYKDFGFIYQLYGDLLLFYDGSDAMRVRSVIGKLFEVRNCHSYMDTISRLEDDFLSGLHKTSSVPLYETFKDMTTALSLKLFLDLDWKEARMEFETIKSISILHWHGLISVPVSLKLRGWTSSFSKAMEAKGYLMRAIKRKLSLPRSDSSNKSFMENAKEAGFQSEDEMVQHLLLFVSALIPKALASLLTSFCIATSGPEKSAIRRRALEDDAYLDNVLLEVQRLWPPFLGGRRFATEDVVVDGHKIPANTAVAFMTWFANRDAEVFSHPTSFMPDRWQDGDKAKRDLVWTFGGGKRICIGVDLINKILKMVCRKLLTDYNWTLVGSQDISYKTLPVARPRQTVMAAFCRH